MAINCFMTNLQEQVRGFQKLCRVYSYLQGYREGRGARRKCCLCDVDVDCLLTTVQGCLILTGSRKLEKLLLVTIFTVASMSGRESPCHGSGRWESHVSKFLNLSLYFQKALIPILSLIPNNVYTLDKNWFRIVLSKHNPIVV